MASPALLVVASGARHSCFSFAPVSLSLYPFVVSFSFCHFVSISFLPVVVSMGCDQAVSLPRFSLLFNARPIRLALFPI